MSGGTSESNSSDSETESNSFDDSYYDSELDSEDENGATFGGDDTSRASAIWAAVATLVVTTLSATLLGSR